jgi:hypothetical protein
MIINAIRKKKQQHAFLKTKQLQLVSIIFVKEAEEQRRKNN